LRFTEKPHKTVKNLRISIRRFNPEVLVWISGLLYLAIITPTSDSHFSFCLFKIIGLEHCPGCGLGQAISYLFHGDFLASFQAHPLGILAVIILSIRIFSLLRRATGRSISPVKIK